jgi:hypothetical protein
MADAARIRADAQRAAEALWARAADEKRNSPEQDQAALRKVVGQVLRELG